MKSKFIFILSIVISFFSCNKDIIKKPDPPNTLFFNESQFSGLTVNAKYFGEKMMFIDFYNSIIKFQFSLTNGSISNLDTGLYLYGKNQNGFRLSVFYNGTEIRAKSGSIKIEYLPSQDKYKFYFNIKSQEEDTIYGNYLTSIKIDDYLNSFLYKNRIYRIENAVSVYYDSSPNDYNYVYLFTKNNDVNSFYIGFVFFGSSSSIIEQGNYAWGGQFGAAIFPQNNVQYDAHNGTLSVEYLGVSSNNVGIYDILFSITCDSLLKGEYRGEIPIISKSDFDSLKVFK